MNKILLVIIFFNTLLCSNISEEIKNMPLKNKIAQMIMIRVDGNYYNNDHWNKKSIERNIKENKIGGVISFTGSIHGTFYNIKEFQENSEIPLFVAADYERGLGQFIGGTLFPSNMAIAATNNPDNAFKQGQITAKEAKAIGVNMIFAPVLDINNNPDNPIINFRSYSDNPETVIQFSSSYILGIQNQGIIACGKHFPGHGDTDTDSHTSLPIINKSKQDLFDNEMRPFKYACDNGIRSIMVGHIILPSIDDKNPSTFSKKITTDILRKEWGYDGLIITDGLEMGALTNHTWHGEAAIKAIEAGADILLLPIDPEIAISTVYNAVIEGRITEDRINESFNRIIAEKNNLGLFNIEDINWSDVETTISSNMHSFISQNIANESITLVKDQRNIIPVSPKKYTDVTHIMLSMDEGIKSIFKNYAKDIKKTHGNVKEIFINDKLSRLGIKEILTQIKKTDLIIISMLVRIRMDKGISTIDDTHNLLISKIKKLKIPILGISFGSPYLPDYSNLDAYICTYGYGSISLNAASNAILGRIDINGKLPVSLNEKFRIGHGIKVEKEYSQFDSELDIDLNGAIKIIHTAINDSIFPGAQIFISQGENIILNKGFGKTSYEDESTSVTTNTIYDVASLTKVLSTTPTIMKLIDKKRISLNYYLSDFYKEYSIEDKQNITLRHLLTHTSGLIAFKEYYKNNNINKDNMIKDIINLKLEYLPDSEMIYSDLGMILLMDIISKVSGSSLDRLSHKYFYKPLRMSNTFFNPNNDKLNLIAPTEIDKHFRKKLLKGIVHDENAYLLNGVSGHAGLFSTAYDIGVFCKMLIDEGYYLGNRILNKAIINEFTNRQNIPVGSDRALGWDTPSDIKSSAGDYFSRGSFGHLGFTGTSMWIDPNKEIIIVLLTNRVYPSRNKNNIKSRMYHLRRDFHNEVMKMILGV